jgi:Na+/proline symporter
MENKAISDQLDAILFIGFLVINLWLGLSSSRGITTLREYSIGNKNFITETIIIFN